MQRNYLFFIILVAGVLFSCKKENNNLPPVTAPDVTPVLLKDIVVQSLPSPYYHFEYNDSGYAAKTSFSSGLEMYDISYASGKISEMKSTHIINKDRLVYEYENGKVFLVKYINEAGVNYKRCFLSYNPSGQLEKMEWYSKQGNVGFVISRTLNFTYYPDGNLFELRDHRHATDGGQNEAIYTDRFENYDDKVNVDGFSLIHDSNDHLILLPGVKLQKNNPFRNIRTGDGVHYEISYTYIYNERNRPVLKNGDAVITSGPGAGQHFHTNALYTYYP